MGVSTTALLAALSSTALISVAPNLILFVFPQFGNDAKGNAILVMGQAMAAGGLLGDVFLHTLSHTTHYEEEHVGSWVLLGFSIFFVVDMILRHHSHSHHHHEQHTNMQSISPQDILLTPTVLLNIAADALHNFTDGLAIGASFASYTVSQNDVTFASLLASRGGLATISIMFHEIPHELGDYCVLLKGGFTKTQAIMAQFTTAIAAMIGTLVGLWAVEGWGSQSMVYLTAGGFVYLASANILPQVLEEQQHAGFRFQLAQLCAFGTGVAFMYGVLMLEDHDHHSRGHDHAHHAHHHEHHDHHAAHDHHEHAHSHDQYEL
jgi:solute carrier family 39 (zinc transporter), member 7